ncbi:hypothetical protein [Wukongibacter sp. M2B1]|uniref:hypothetical protein n=1 Tax=Wukongibacter sp. M2B1 TaxID=3088895 RepID=UPI003D78B55B
MQHSIIVRVFKRIFEFIKKYYGFSCTSKIINEISNTMRRFFVNSFIYGLFINENRNLKNYIGHSLVGKSEGLFQKLLGALNPIYKKGVQGSFILKRQARIKSSKCEVIGKLISLIIVGAVISYNLFSIMNRSFYLDQMYISIIIITLAINVYFIDIEKVYNSSLIKRVFEDIFYV